MIYIYKYYYYNKIAFIVQCTAHWSEGNTNYLIGKVFSNDTQRTSYRCLAYTELPASEATLSRTAAAQRNDPNFIDLSGKKSDGYQTARTTLQIHVSQDEFCRNIDNVIDEQFSFTFSKGMFLIRHNIHFLAKLLTKINIDTF